MNKKLGIALINLVDKYQKLSQKKEKYFLLTYKLQRALTNQYFQLSGETKPTLKSNHEPLFLFNPKKKFGYSLKSGQIYYVEYIERSSKYFHIQDWRILGDKLSVQRTFNLLRENFHLLSTPIVPYSHKCTLDKDFISC